MSSLYRSILNVQGSSFSNLQSLQFDGVDDSFSFSQISKSGVFSLSYWFKFTGTFNLNANCFVWGISNSNISFFKLQTSTQVILKLNGTTYTINESGGNNIPQNTWANFTLVRNASNSVQLYLNGNVFGSSITSSNTFTINSFGRIINSFFGFLGYIDEVAYFESELSTSDVTSIYNSGIPNDISSVSGLVSWWRFEGTGTTATDSGSGGNNGTLTNGVTRSTDVPTFVFNRKSIELDGIDDYVTFGSMTGSSLAITGDISISMWLKFSNSGGTEYAMNMGDQYGIYTSGGTIRGFSRIGGVFTALSSVGTFNDNAWHHVLYVKNATNMYLYIDGSLNASNTSGGTNLISSLDMRLGARYTTANFYEGLMDEVAIWNSDQSSNVSSIYNSGIPNDISSLSPLSWWRCGDGDIAQTITDNGSGGNNGTMINFTTFSTDVPT